MPIVVVPKSKRLLLLESLSSLLEDSPEIKSQLLLSLILEILSRSLLEVVRALKVIERLSSLLYSYLVASRPLLFSSGRGPKTSLLLSRSLSLTLETLILGGGSAVALRAGATKVETQGSLPYRQQKGVQPINLWYM